MLKWLLAPLGLFLCLNVEAATWYVRPAADCANNGDGTAYACAASGGAAGAWRTMANVAWGVSGVNTGDTLRACSSESSPFTTADYDGGGLAVLSVDQSGVTVDGDCSASGGETMAYMTGNGTRDYGVYCADTTTCPNQTWRNITVTSTDVRGFYIRNNLSTTGTVLFIGSGLSCNSIVGAEGNTPQCVAGFGTGGTLTNITSNITTDDSVHWEGDNFSISDSRLLYPGYNVSTNLGDCVQVVNQADNAIIRRVYCDHTNSATKQCFIYGDPVDASDDNAEISDSTCLYPETGNISNANKLYYSSVPATQFLRNYGLGGAYGVYMLGAGSTTIGNVMKGQEVRGIDVVSTVTSGTHLVANNTVSGSPTCVAIGGGASVTTLFYNNLVANCSSAGFTKGGSSTLTQSNNRCGQSVTTCNNGGGGSSISDAGWVGGATPTSAQGFRLSATSAARGIGLDLNRGNIQDNGNRAFAHPPSIGAWEAASGDIATARAAATARTAASARTAATARTAR